MRVEAGADCELGGWRVALPWPQRRAQGGRHGYKEGGQGQACTIVCSARRAHLWEADLVLERQIEVVDGAEGLQMRGANESEVSRPRGERAQASAPNPNCFHLRHDH